MVMGGAGFIGRHVVTALLGHGHQVVVGSRRPDSASRRLGAAASVCERRTVRFERLLEAGRWAPLLDGIAVAINCAGILRERGAETYHAVHVAAPVALAHACRERGIRFLHVSALGLRHPHRSAFLRSKRAAEDLLANSGGDYRLVRPSLLDGDGGFGARWIRRLARLPLHVLARGANGRIAALEAGDLGEAVARLAMIDIAADATREQREFELGGLAPRDIGEYMQALREQRGLPPARCLRVPAWLARLGSHGCDLAHFSPFSFGHWELLQQDNMPAPNRLLELLGRPPRGVGAPAAAPTLSLGSWARPQALASSSERSAPWTAQ